jgi:SAM-dependent methyltransferase
LDRDPVIREDFTVIRRPRLVDYVSALALAVGVASPAGGQTRADCERQYTPQRGQEGKDVVWAPTEDSMLVRMLAMANVTSADKLYDLGSGDGKIPIAAAKHFGATAVGIEYDADLVKHARCLAAADGVQARVTFLQGDIFETDFSAATVVTLYLLPALNLRLRPTLLDLKPGTRIVSYSFTMGEWEPDDHIDSFGDGAAYLWIVPANVNGGWTFRAANGGESFDVELEQTFQHLSGAVGRATVAGSLEGDEISFAFTQGAEPTRIIGTVENDRITAIVTRGETSTDYVGARN